MSKPSLVSNPRNPALRTEFLLLDHTRRPVDLDWDVQTIRGIEPEISRREDQVSTTRPHTTPGRSKLGLQIIRGIEPEISRCEDRVSTTRPHTTPDSCRLRCPNQPPLPSLRERPQLNGRTFHLSKAINNSVAKRSQTLRTEQ
ncbi:hypothetical protein ElyMa_000516000 [Elysia marginata]|uniref:Uncharacterized protein n=1 Tax=Elysia marginata TaxID=1093978 RepID=A0AAV4FWY3_9GAST|nr:hypothetical protein ElyMa_000516000 [Elysia marginata]